MSDPGQKKRAIDRRRNAAFSVDVTDPDDPTGIVDFLKISEKQSLIIKGRSIHEVILPDQIDPERTNPDLRPIQRRVLAYGAESELVGRTLLTAQVFFSKNLLKAFNSERALQLALDGLKDLVAMHQLHSDLEKTEERVVVAFQQQKISSSIKLPSIPDIEARCDMFAQKAGHVVGCLEEMAKLFYADELKSRWVTTLAELASKRYGSEDPFADFMNRVSSFLIMVINVRNAVEHRAPDNRLDVTDYVMNGDGSVNAPVVELVHKDTPFGPVAVVIFMKSLIDSLVTIFEEMMAHLCAHKVESFAGMKIFVSEVPSERRRPNKPRFEYIGRLPDGRFAPFG